MPDTHTHWLPRAASTTHTYIHTYIHTVHTVHTYTLDTTCCLYNTHIHTHITSCQHRSEIHLIVSFTTECAVNASLSQAHQLAGHVYSLSPF